MDCVLLHTALLGAQCNPEQATHYFATLQKGAAPFGHALHAKSGLTVVYKSVGAMLDHVHPRIGDSRGYCTCLLCGMLCLQKRIKVARDSPNDLRFGMLVEHVKLKRLMEGIFKIRPLKVFIFPSNSKANACRSITKIKKSLS